MKETNINKINEVATQLLEELQPKALDYIDKWRYTAFLTMAYLNNNQGKETTVRSAVEGYMTVIVTQTAVSVISDDGVIRHWARYGIDLPVCLYEDLEQDMRNIIGMIEAAIHKMGL